MIFKFPTLKNLYILILFIISTSVFSQTIITTTITKTAGNGESIPSTGTFAWTDFNNIATPSTTDQSSIFSLDGTSDYLQGTNYGFLIPAGATILGIEVKIVKNRGGGNSSKHIITDSEVRLLKNGIVTTNNKAKVGVDWPTGKTASIYGGNNDLWGTIWLPSDINLGNFGAVISASGTWNSVDVYSIEISVTYSIPCVSPAAPIIGTITQPTCTVPTGSVVLSGLPSGGWELTQNPGNVKINGSGANPTIPDLSPNTYTYSVVKNGLKAEYFNNMTFSGTPALTRTDATVNFNWVNLGPGGPIGNDYFSVRWSGQIQPLVTEDYNFRTRSDDGIRLWVNGVKIIDNWSIHSLTFNYGTISLVAGVKYDIVLEFYENDGRAVSELNWKRASQSNLDYQIIPQSQLFNGCPSSVSGNVVIAANQINEWNGDVSSDWNDPANWCLGVPSITNVFNVKIPTVLASGNYPILSTGASGYVTNILFESGATSLNVVDNFIEIAGTLTLNGKIDLQGEAQLIQATGSVLDPLSTGNIEIDQQGNGNRYRYNYWSSPVNNLGTTYTIGGVLKDGTTSTPGPIAYTSGYDGSTSPMTLSTVWMYKFVDSQNGYSAWVPIGNSGTLKPGEGFTMKGPGNSGSPDQNYTFVGKPNNGDISLMVGDGNEYLVGNPYPSAISTDQFLYDNRPTGLGGSGSIRGEIYFWEHYGGDSHYLSAYQGGYASVNLSGAVKGAGPDPMVNQTSPSSPKIPGDFIPVGQSFFVVGESTGSNPIVFNNGQRSFQTESMGNSVFMKSNNSKSNATKSEWKDDRPKFRIGFKAPKVNHRHLLLTIDERATDSLDWGFDAEIYEVHKDDMFWMINNKKYVIQATNAISFDKDIPLGIVTKDGGLVSIMVDALENVDDTVELYIKDNVTGQSHRIKEKAFEISLPAGEYTDRFALAFKSVKPQAEEEIVIEGGIKEVEHIVVEEEEMETVKEGVHVYMNHSTSELHIRKNKSIEIIGVRLLNNLGQIDNAWNRKFKGNEIILPVKSHIGVYVVQIITSNGVTYSKKIIIK